MGQIDFGIFWDRGGEPHVAANDGMVAYGGVASQNGGFCIDNHTVANSGMPFLIGFVFGNTQGAQGNALVYFDVVPNLGCFSNDNTSPMVNTKPRAYFGAWVDIDACFPMGNFCHHSGDNRDFGGVEKMGGTVNPCGLQTGIGQDDFGIALRGRVASVGGVDVLGKDMSHLGNKRKKATHNVAGLFGYPLYGRLRLFGVPSEAFLNLLGEPLADGDDLLANDKGKIFLTEGECIKIAGEKDVSDLEQQMAYAMARGEREGIAVVNGAQCLVRL